jgi:hypothetical protein
MICLCIFSCAVRVEAKRDPQITQPEKIPSICFLSVFFSSVKGKMM